MGLSDRKEKVGIGETKHPGGAELVSGFAEIGLPFRAEDPDEDLAYALMETPRFQTYRRGCGFAHATRLLQGPIFYPRVFSGSWIDEFRKKGVTDQQWRLNSFILPFACLFDPSVVARFEKMHSAIEASGFRVSAAFQLFEDNSRLSEVKKKFENEILCLTQLREIEGRLKLEGASVFARIVVDCIFPKKPSENACQVRETREHIESGTCSTAERYFLNWLRKSKTWYPQQKMDIIVDGKNRPVILQMRGIDGADIGIEEYPIAMNIRPILLNGVELPSGSLLAVKRENDGSDHLRQTKSGDGNVVPLSACEFQFGRLMTLAISSQNRASAFGIQYKTQKTDNFPDIDADIVAFALRAASEVSRGPTS